MPWEQRRTRRVKGFGGLLRFRVLGLWVLVFRDLGNRHVGFKV